MIDIVYFLKSAASIALEITAYVVGIFVVGGAIAATVIYLSGQWR